MLLIIPHLNCNIFCRYCYEKKYRSKHTTKTNDYDLEILFKKMEELKESHSDMCLHGGEPLMLPKKDVRKILLKIKELTGKSSIQTNGVLIDDDFIEIFKECNTAVGLSYDGPGELSEYRFYGLKEDPKIEQKIEKMIKEGISVSLITVLSKANAGTDVRLNKLKKYLLKINELKINGRINPCGGFPEYELNEKRIKKVYLELAQFCLLNNLAWSPFTDVINGLKNQSRVCIFMGCDLFSTPSAAELLGDGSLTNCMRVNQEHILLRHPLKYETRKEILQQTPQEFGGCQGCRYWQACYGGCPTMAINNDWRNKTYLCSLWYSLFQFYEKVLSHCGITINLCQTTETIANQKSYENSEHIDHTDAAHYDVSGEELFSPEIKKINQNYQHLDSDHGDQIEHQDHTDESHNDISRK